MKRFIFFLILLFILSACDSKISFNSLELYNGVTDLTPFGNDKICFIANLNNYKYLMVLVYANINGDILKIETIDKFVNIDVSLEQVKVFNFNNKITIAYSNINNKIDLIKYNDFDSFSKMELSLSSKSYGSFIEYNDQGDAIFIKSDKIYKSGDPSGYWFNYYKVDNELNILNQMNIFLGNLFPLGYIMLNGNIYFYVNDNQLMKKNINSSEISSIYNFEQEIIDIDIVNGNVLVLLKESVFLVSDEGELLKSFNLLGNAEGFFSKNIIHSQNGNITIELSNGFKTMYKEFSITGNPSSQKIINSLVVGDSYFFDSNGIKKLFYSTKSTLFIEN
ncbi:MAG: hypothetical protein JXR64_01875, partial [Spirochaetales bacterium]|nr:hypothetical protein [Spirochaetales bacterium]